MPYATADDVLDRWAGANPPERRLAETYAADAETHIRTEIPDLDDRIGESWEDGGVAAEQVRLIVVEMVKRALWNPDRETSESITDYSVAREAGMADRSLRLLPSERLILLGNRPKETPRAFTVTMGPTEAPTGYLGGCDTDWT